MLPEIQVGDTEEAGHVTENRKDQEAKVVVVQMIVWAIFMRQREMS